uniref:Uncharacterized protein n=1 Tax=Rhabditophanes sp. KR3021 TaxID=114890 RepID=A0AC35TKV2_9BILA
MFTRKTVIQSGVDKLLNVIQNLGIKSNQLALLVCGIGTEIRQSIKLELNGDCKYKFTSEKAIIENQTKDHPKENYCCKWCNVVIGGSSHLSVIIKKEIVRNWTKKDDKSYFKAIVPQMGVSAKELAENLEYILTEYLGAQVKNIDYGKCSFEEVYKTSPDSAQLIGQLIIGKMFGVKEEIPVAFNIFFYFYQ